MQESIHNANVSKKGTSVPSVDAMANETLEYTPLLKLKVQVMTEVVADSINEAAEHSKAGRSSEARRQLRMVRKVLREFDELIVDSTVEEENGV